MEEKRNEETSLDDGERTRCEIWSRVMGYHRPVPWWNEGKQQEHSDRKMFREPGTGYGQAGWRWNWMDADD